MAAAKRPLLSPCGGAAVTSNLAGSGGICISQHTAATLVARRAEPNAEPPSNAASAAAAAAVAAAAAAAAVAAAVAAAAAAIAAGGGDAARLVDFLSGA